MQQGSKKHDVCLLKEVTSVPMKLGWSFSLEKKIVSKKRSYICTAWWKCISKKALMKLKCYIASVVNLDLVMIYLDIFGWFSALFLNFNKSIFPSPFYLLKISELSKRPWCCHWGRAPVHHLVGMQKKSIQNWLFFFMNIQSKFPKNRAVFDRLLSKLLWR